MNPPKRPTTTVPPNKEPLIAIASDKEATRLRRRADVQAAAREDEDGRRLPPRPDGAALSRRCSTRGSTRSRRSRTRRSSAPARRRAASSGATTDAFTLGAEREGRRRSSEGSRRCSLEAKRVDEFGFLQTELDRAKQNMLRGYERAYAERDKTQSAVVRAGVHRQLSERRADSRASSTSTSSSQQLVPTITLADVNKLASNWITRRESRDHRRVAGEGQREGADARRIAGGVRARGERRRSWRTRRTCRPSGAASTNDPAPGKIVSDEDDSGGERHGVDAVERRARAREADRLQGRRSVVQRVEPGRLVARVGSGLHVGGIRVAESSGSAASATSIAIDLRKKLAGKAAGVRRVDRRDERRPERAARRRRISRRCSSSIYLDFTAPRLDTAAFRRFKNQAAAVSSPTRGADPDRGVRRHGERGRWRSTTSARVRSRRRRSPRSNPEKALAFYKDRFADASDFTFVFVGNVDTVTLKPLVEKYLASLPSISARRRSATTAASPPKGVVEKVVRKGVEPKANTIIEFTGACTYAPETRFAFRALVELLPDQAERDAAREAGRRVQPERRRRVRPRPAAGVLDRRCSSTRRRRTSRS